MIQKNIPFLKKIKISPWRALALCSWDSTSEASVYGLLEIPMDSAIAYAQHLSQKTGEKITVTHIVVKALALTVQRHPEINTLIRWGQIYQRSDVDIFCHVALDQLGLDLSGVVIRQADQKSVLSIAQELNLTVRSLRLEGDKKFEKIKKSVLFLPTFFLRKILNLTGFLLFNLNIWSPLLGTDRDPFGSVMLTNVGSLDIDFALPPLVGYSRTSLILSMGALRKKLRLSASGQVEEINTIQFGVTFDHRLIDGVHSARMAKFFREYLENPSQWDL